MMETEDLSFIARDFSMYSHHDDHFASTFTDNDSLDAVGFEEHCFYPVNYENQTSFSSSCQPGFQHSYSHHPSQQPQQSHPNPFPNPFAFEGSASYASAPHHCSPDGHQTASAFFDDSHFVGQSEASMYSTFLAEAANLTRDRVESDQFDDVQVLDSVKSIPEEHPQSPSPAGEASGRRLTQPSKSLPASGFLRLRMTSIPEGIAKLSDEELYEEEREMERQAKIAKHKHRKGTVCPRCKVDQRLKQVRRLIQKRTMMQYRQRSASAFLPCERRKKMRRTSEPSTPTGAAGLFGKTQPTIQPSSLPYSSSFTLYTSNGTSTPSAVVSASGGGAPQETKEGFP